MNPTEVQEFFNQAILPWILVAGSIVSGCLIVVIPVVKYIKSLITTIKELRAAAELNSSKILEQDQIISNIKGIEQNSGVSLTQLIEKLGLLDKIDKKFDAVCFNCPMAIANKTAEKVNVINNESIDNGSISQD